METVVWPLLVLWVGVLAPTQVVTGFATPLPARPLSGSNPPEASPLGTALGRLRASALCALCIVRIAWIACVARVSEFWACAATAAACCALARAAACAVTAADTPLAPPGTRMLPARAGAAAANSVSALTLARRAACTEARGREGVWAT